MSTTTDRTLSTSAADIMEIAENPANVATDSPDIIEIPANPVNPASDSPDIIEIPANPAPIAVPPSSNINEIPANPVAANATARLPSEMSEEEQIAYAIQLSLQQTRDVNVESGRSSTSRFHPYRNAASNDRREETISEECSICLDSISARNALGLPCAHLFHKLCIEKWMNTRRTCPICRRFITPGEFIAGNAFQPPAGPSTSFARNPPVRAERVRIRRRNNLNSLTTHNNRVQNFAGIIINNELHNIRPRLPRDPMQDLRISFRSQWQDDSILNNQAQNYMWLPSIHGPNVLPIPNNQAQNPISSILNQSQNLTTSNNPAQNPTSSTLNQTQNLTTSNNSAQNPISSTLNPSQNSTTSNNPAQNPISSTLNHSQNSTTSNNPAQNPISSTLNQSQNLTTSNNQAQSMLNSLRAINDQIDTSRSIVDNIITPTNNHCRELLMQLRSDMERTNNTLRRLITLANILDRSGAFHNNRIDNNNNRRENNNNRRDNNNQNSVISHEAQNTAPNRAQNVRRRFYCPARDLTINSDSDIQTLTRLYSTQSQYPTMMLHNHGQNLTSSANHMLSFGNLSQNSTIFSNTPRQRLESSCIPLVFSSWQNNRSIANDQVQNFERIGGHNQGRDSMEYHVHRINNITGRVSFDEMNLLRSSNNQGSNPTGLFSGHEQNTTGNSSYLRQNSSTLDQRQNLTRNFINGSNSTVNSNDPEQNSARLSRDRVLNLTCSTNNGPNSIVSSNNQEQNSRFLEQNSISNNTNDQNITVNSDNPSYGIVSIVPYSPLDSPGSDSSDDAYDRTTNGNHIPPEPVHESEHSLRASVIRNGTNNQEQNSSIALYAELNDVFEYL